MALALKNFHIQSVQVCERRLAIARLEPQDNVKLRVGIFILAPMNLIIVATYTNCPDDLWTRSSITF